ncbi:hypothetical protein Btru_016283 [Bulinus truncatus]|nr:hypothetical protein Btru_016283 [Bulinus truncatus]
MATRKPQVLQLCHKLDTWSRCRAFSSSISLQKLYLSSHETLPKTISQRKFILPCSLEHINRVESIYKAESLSKIRSFFMLSSYAQNSNNYQQSKHKAQYFFFNASSVPAILKIILSLIIMGTLYSLISDGLDMNIMTNASCSSKKSEDDSDKKHKKKDKKKSSKKKKEKVSKVDNLSLSSAIEQAQQLCIKKKEQVGCPGIVVCVSVDGKQVYAEGFGYADLENHTPIRPNSVLRIASISKAITATIIAKLYENNQIDLDQVIQHYVPDFPEKEFLGEKVSITVRQLLNHTSGIRHYKADDDLVYASDRGIASLLDKFKAVARTPFFVVKSSRDCSKKTSDKKFKKAKKEKSEMERKEYYIAKPYNTTKESLTLFANDRLLAKPGARYIYTTYGYTVLAAVVEAVTKKPFTDVLKETLRQLGLQETYLDYNNPIIYNRARSYVKDSRGSVINAPYVDLSYKWAGGGLLSSPEDMVKFGNILLYSAQHSHDDPGLQGYLSSSTLATFWLPKETSTSKYYGLGFEVVPGREDYGLCADLKFGAGHSGAAVGVSSALFILPRYLPEGFLGANGKEKPTEIMANNVNHAVIQSDFLQPVNLPYEIPTIVHIDDQHINADEPFSAQLVSYIKNKHKDSPHEPTSGPKGVVVAVFTNMVDVSVTDVAENIARIFEKVESSKNK